MHSSTIATIFTFALAVSAIPTGEHGGSGGSPPTCSTSAANKCCNGFKQEGLLGILQNVGLGCTNIIGSTCTSGTAACCHNQNNGLVVVDVCALAI